ncbi:MAG: NAD(P)/FAD-dependent oxidoreductase [Gammaproteobacteria bacterium]|nr:NAD(P)/FAD-dependent oxidoreductase [Gammaproteobacteria bacterium]
MPENRDLDVRPEANGRPPATRQLDAVVIGAGFSGLFALYKLRDGLGLDVQGFETADGVGGTWFWNRYPGARCDSESFYYCFTFSDELAQEWEWSSRYPEQPEIERYLNHVADRFGLRRNIQFNTRVTRAEFDESSNRWDVYTEHGEHVRARFLVAAVGCLSDANLPDIPGRDSFAGESYHTARWPREGVDFTGKHVGLIGTGSSGIQATPVIAAEARHLTVFQRTPNFTVPARNAPFKPEDQAAIKRDYPAIFARTRESNGGFPYFGIERRTVSVSPEERKQILDELWEEGGFKFVWGGFSDVTTDLQANEIVSEYIRERIRKTVSDPETAELLCPYDHPYTSKRPPIDTDYYVTFNRDNVSLVDVRTSPIQEITPGGLRTADAQYDLDVLVYATGFDAMTGSLLRMDIRGSNGVRLADAWAHGPRTLLGLQVAGFPNLFTITGPGSPSVLINMPTAIEHHVNWITECIAHMRRNGNARIDATERAQDAWAEHVAEVAEYTLWSKSKGNSWYVGANIPGKPRIIMPYTGGQPLYRERCQAVVDAGYEGFEFSD